MGKTTSTERMRDMKERAEYTGPDSCITLNRAFAAHVASMIPGTPEAGQIMQLVRDSQNQARMKDEYSLWSRPFIS